MKLLVLTAVKYYEKEIKNILKKSGVKNYTYKDAVGYRDLSGSSVQENWFANDMHEGMSIVFFAFVSNESIDMVFDKVSEFNEDAESFSHIHVAALPIERSV